MKKTTALKVQAYSTLKRLASGPTKAILAIATTTVVDTVTHLIHPKGAPETIERLFYGWQINQIRS